MIVDTDDLIDTAEAAAILGLAGQRSLSVYRSRHPDFPAPVVSRPSGRCLLWRRQDVEAWAAQR